MAKAERDSRLDGASGCVAKPRRSKDDRECLEAVKAEAHRASASFIRSVQTGQPPGLLRREISGCCAFRLSRIP